MTGPEAIEAMAAAKELAHELRRRLSREEISPHEFWEQSDYLAECVREAAPVMRRYLGSPD